MNNEYYKYNFLENNTFYISNELKKKGKHYGIATFNKNQVNILIESLDLMSVSPSIPPIFSLKLERFIVPRFLEINEIVYANKSLPDNISIEFSKEHQKDIIKAFDLPNVITKLKEDGYSNKDFIALLHDIKFLKYK
ncbi:MAG: hypothetical protein ACFFCI_15860 [Promethearchaeota archaeon]